MTTKPHTDVHVAPPFDPELAAFAEQVRVTGGSTLRPEGINAARTSETREVTDADLEAAHIQCLDHKIRSYDGREILVSVLRSDKPAGPGPCLFYIHGGGMVAGDRWSYLGDLLPWIDQHTAVIATVEYRLAPEHPHPTPVEDCYAALTWAAEHAHNLRVDPGKIILVGRSAGGGLAAATALLARDRQGFPLLGQMLMYPMLDDRNDSISARQIDGIGIWDRTSNATGWNALLNDTAGGPGISEYAAPARATDYSRLPPTFIDCGSVEVFRDEDVAFANNIWAAGGEAELHVWPGGFHAFELGVPHARLSHEMRGARNAWLTRLLARER